MSQQHTANPARRGALRLAATSAMVLGAFGLGANAAVAQDTGNWPDKNIRVIVNFPPGGLADTLARMVAEPVGQALGQTIVVENRAGAGGNIGAEAVARSDPDGYTFLVSSGGVPTINPHIYTNLAYDPNEDLSPVAALARVKVFLVAQPDLPFDDVAGMIEYAKANPGELTYPSPGNGSSPHIAAEMFSAEAGIEALHVPYRGAAPALVDLLAGQTDFFFDPGIGLQHVKDGKLRLLAVGSLERSSMYPDTPTLDELGVEGFDADTIFGLYAPAGTDPAIIERMNAEVNKALESEKIQSSLEAVGASASPMSIEQFRERILADKDRFGALIEERGIVAN